jgi:hypothetical protein
VRLRVLVDILSGASAGGINAVFLAQALATGQSLEPLTRLWLARADSDVLLDPDARPWGRFAKFWAQPLVWAVLRWSALRAPDGELSRQVGGQAPENKLSGEVRRKVSRLIRARWFARRSAASAFPACWPRRWTPWPIAATPRRCCRRATRST